ncbi:MAG: hypothetical protein ABSC23_16975, partial [Bryobacteraceae bacterium]
FEFGGIFAGDDEKVRISAVFQGVEAGSGLAFLSTWTGRALGVETIGLDLSGRCHRETSGTRVTGERGGSREVCLEVIGE